MHEKIVGRRNGQKSNKRRWTSKKSFISLVILNPSFAFLKVCYLLVGRVFLVYEG